MRWLPYVPRARKGNVNQVTRDALAEIRVAVAMLEEAVGDTEPAPVSIVLVQSVDGGKVHRAARIEGIPGYMTYEADNLDAAEYRTIPDLSRVDDDMNLCRRCFGVIDVENDEAPE